MFWTDLKILTVRTPPLKTCTVGTRQKSSVNTPEAESLLPREALSRNGPKTYLNGARYHHIWTKAMQKDGSVFRC